MKIKRIKDLENTERHVKGVGFDSIRVLLESDNMGFSLHKTIIPKGEPQHWHYKNHLESCYCIKGGGVITNLSTNEKHNIEIDTTYILDNHDDHTFQATEDTVLISVFNPPVTGDEIHKSDGSYEKPVKDTMLIKKIIDVSNSCNNNYDLYDKLKELLIINNVI